MAGDSNSNTFGPRLFVDAELSNTAAVAAAAADDDDDHKRSYLVYLRPVSYTHLTLPTIYSV